MSRRFASKRETVPPVLSRVSLALAICACTVPALAQESPPIAISREVKDVFNRCGKGVVKIRGVDQHGEFAGTGFFADPTGTVYTAYSVGGEGESFTVEVDGKKLPAHVVLADVRSGIALLKADLAPSPALPIGSSSSLEVATPVVTIGYPLDLPQTPSFGMIAGFDKKLLGRYLSTTHLRVNLPTQRGEAGAPLINFKGEVVGILVSSVENGSACYALPIDAAEKIRNDWVRFGEARHGWVGIEVTEAEKAVEGSRAQMTEIIDDTPARDSGVEPGDILLQVGNKPIHEPEDVIDASFFITAGDTVPVTVLRDGKKLTFNIASKLHPNIDRKLIASPLSPSSQGIRLNFDNAARRTP
ncbi:MAG: S1C family serine protease [Chthoniobacterales bacterium]|jgi:S1-C subfamily serine protease